MQWLMSFEYDGDHTYRHSLSVILLEKEYQIVKSLEKFPELSLTYGHGNDSINVEVTLSSSIQIEVTDDQQDVIEGTYGLEYRQVLTKFIEDPFRTGFVSVDGDGYRFIVMGDIPPTERQLKFIEKRHPTPHEEFETVTDFENSVNTVDIYWTNPENGRFELHSIFPREKFRNGAVKISRTEFYVLDKIRKKDPLLKKRFGKIQYLDSDRTDIEYSNSRQKVDPYGDPITWKVLEKRNNEIVILENLLWKDDDYLAPIIPREELIKRMESSPLKERFVGGAYFFREDNEIILLNGIDPLIVHKDRKFADLISEEEAKQRFLEEIDFEGWGYYLQGKYGIYCQGSIFEEKPTRSENAPVWAGGSFRKGKEILLLRNHMKEMPEGFELLSEDVTKNLFENDYDNWDWSVFTDGGLAKLPTRIF